MQKHGLKKRMPIHDTIFSGLGINGCGSDVPFYTHMLKVVWFSDHSSGT